MNNQQKFEAQMQSLTPEFREKFYEAQQEEWNKLPFTSTAINEHFDRYREFALMFETAIGRQVTHAYFVHLMHGKIESYFVSDIVTLCQAFERRTYFEFVQVSGAGIEGVTKAQRYADFLSMAEQITTELNAIVEPIKDKIVRKMQTLQQLELKSGRKLQMA